MKPFLVDVPVRVNIWIRPECQRAQFEVLKKARPSIMFLQSDGGRNEKEWTAIYQNRKIFEEEIDWECTVYKIYETENQGLYAMGRKVSAFIWERVDRCVFLEDDYVPSVSFFQYCAELLEKYKDDTRIEAICAMNHVGVWEDTDNDYFFSRYGSIWGMATWRRIHEERALGFAYADDPYTHKLILRNSKGHKSFRKCLNGYAKQSVYRGHVAGGEFFHALAIYGQSRYYIIPKKNMMNNIGCTKDAAHSGEYKLLPRASKRVFNMKTYELEFPLKCPKYVVTDVKYEKARCKIMATHSSIRRFFRRIEGLLLSIRYGTFFKKLKNHYKRKKQIEK